MHWYSKEELRDGKWVLVSRSRCFCHIKENHWAERPDLEESAS